MSYSRPEPLARLLRSLDAAAYDGDTLELTIWVDAPKAGKEAPAGRADVIALAEGFSWRHGPKRVEVRTEHQGLRGQWLTIYSPHESDNSAAIILEDDLEVSPAYYRWVKKALVAYGAQPDVGALSLQRPTLVPKGKGVKFPPDTGGDPFMYKLPGSWGFVAIAKPWARFLSWYKEKSAIRDWVPQVKGLVTTDWYNQLRSQGRDDTMWTQWFIRYCDDFGLYSVYAKGPNGQTLCANWQEKGEHFGKTMGKDFNTVPAWNAELDRFPAPAAVQRFNWEGKRVAAAPVPAPLPVPVPAPAAAVPAPAAAVPAAFSGPEIRIAVLTFTRDKSLQRLLKSLTLGRYEDDVVPLDIYIDAPTDVTNPPAGWEAVKRIAHEYDWTHGPKTVHVRESNAGLVRQWTETWIPASDHESCLMLEDDLELSPLFYKFLKRSKARYGHVEELFGVSLQHMTLQAKGGGRINIPPQDHPYTYRLLGSWGMMPFGGPWRKFQGWLKEKQADPSFHPYVDGLVTTNWYKMFEKQGKTNTMWTAWAIKFCDTHGYTTLFSNLRSRTLCANWQEQGLHFDGKSVGKDFPLVDLNKEQEVLALPDAIRQYDWAGHSVGTLQVAPPPAPVPVAAPVEQQHEHEHEHDEGETHAHTVSATDLKASLAAVAKDNTVILTVANFGYINFAQNWLCGLRELGITNYLFYATDEKAFHWLEQHGEMVFHDHTGKGETEAAVDYGSVKYQELILARTKFVMSCLDLGYHVLLVDVDTYWLQDPAPYLNDDSKDIIAQQEDNGDMCGGFLLLRHTPNTLKFWRNVKDKHQSIVNDAKSRGKLASMDQSEQQYMNQLAKKMPEMRIKKLDKYLFPHGKRFFTQSVPAKPVVVHNNYVIGSSQKIRRFKSKGLWKVVDGDQCAP